MGGLFGGNKDPAPVQQPVTLAAPPPLTADAITGQGAAQADALKRAQSATLATDATAGDAGDYSKKTLG